MASCFVVIGPAAVTPALAGYGEKFNLTQYDMLQFVDRFGDASDRTPSDPRKR